MIDVVIGIVLDQNDAVLIAFRPIEAYKGGVWEFPGGKVEVGESEFAALQRELAEEVGIEMISAEPFLSFSYDYPERQMQLSVWLVTEYAGEAYGREGQAIKWVERSELEQCDMLVANQRIIDKIMSDTTRFEN